MVWQRNNIIITTCMHAVDMIKDCVLSNSAQILTSCSKINSKSADIHSISQCTEVYFILSMDKICTYLISNVLLTQFNNARLATCTQCVTIFYKVLIYRHSEQY